MGPYGSHSVRVKQGHQQGRMVQSRASHWEKGNWGRRQIPGFGEAAGLTQPPDTPTQAHWGPVHWTQPSPFPRCRSSPPHPWTPDSVQPSYLEARWQRCSAQSDHSQVKCCPAPSLLGLAAGRPPPPQPPVHISLNLLLFCTLNACW